MTEPSAEQKGKRLLYFVVAWAVLAAIFLSTGAVYLFRARKATVEAVRMDQVQRTRAGAATVAFSSASKFSNSVSIVLGEQEVGHGLKLNEYEKDGRSTVEQVEGVSARVIRMREERPNSSVYLYFGIDPGFKQQDLSSVRIEVEYLAPSAGTMGIHYDARDAEGITNPKYRDANSQIRLAGSTRWQKAIFETKGDALFNERQNGQSDFRIWSKTPTLFLRKVTVTREISPAENWATRIGPTNQVSVILGSEKPEDGLRYIPDGSDSRTAIEEVNGSPCRHLDRMREGRMFGSCYFAINPTFKATGLTNARVEIEYFCREERSFRVQFDGMDGQTRQRYWPVLAEGAKVMRFGTGADYSTAPEIGRWAVATFHITNAVFRNSQKSKADFRIEVVPPDIYLRRVTVTKE